jgi:hypothetical protein
MRTSWRTAILAGFVASAPIGAVLLATQLFAEPRVAHLAAVTATLLAVPWIVPAWVALAALSSPLYVWLAMQGHAPDAMSWLGRVVLLAAVVGCHVNGALLLAAWRIRHEVRTRQSGLGDFLRRIRSWIRPGAHLTLTAISLD